MKAKGHVFKYGDNVDTDVIIPARYLNSFDAQELASHAMVDIDPDFVKKVQPGDLIFYRNGSRIGHVAMYIGGGRVVHASNPSDGIKISNAYYRHPVKIGRVMN